MLNKIKGGLIVSCQALENEPLHSSFIMSRMALAAQQGGAVAIRSNSVSDINEIKKVTNLPVIGLIKSEYNGSEVYITPTLIEVKKLLETDCEIIAVDATKRKRPNGDSLKTIVEMIHRAKKLAMADISTFEEAKQAELLGFDLVSTTLAGYTDYSYQTTGPDYKVVEECVNGLSIPVIAEGRISSPEELEAMLQYDVFAVVIGSAITRPQYITEKFNKIIKSKQKDLVAS